MTIGLFLATAGLVLLTNLLVRPVVAQIGDRSVARWVTDSPENSFQHLRSHWRVVSGLTALILWLGTVRRLPLLEPIASADGLMGELMGLVFPIFLIGMLAALLTELVRIDWRSQLLPDPLTIAMTIAGFLFHGFTNPNDLIHSLLGAAVGYGFLWILAATYKKLRGVSAMGRGDFAMTAALGAWLGWQLLPLALSIACVFGLLMVIVQRIQPQDLSRTSFLSHEVPFGPALAVGFILAWVPLG